MKTKPKPQKKTTKAKRRKKKRKKKEKAKKTHNVRQMLLKLNRLLSWELVVFSVY